MKNIKYLLQTVAVVAITALAVACSSDDVLSNIETTSGKSKTITLTAYQPGSEGETRIGFDRDGKAYWHAGDEIGVLSKNMGSGSKFVLSEGAGTGAASFTGTAPDNMDKYAIYPYGSGGRVSDSIALFIASPTPYYPDTVDQTLFPENKDGQTFNMPMLGTISDDYVVSFKHLGGVICLQVDKMPTEEGTIKIVDLNNNFRWGILNLSDANPELTMRKVANNHESMYPSMTNNSSCINMSTFPYHNATVGAPGIFYFPMLPGTYDLIIQVYGDKKISTIKTSVDIKRANLHVVKVKINNDVDNSKTINGHKFVDLGLPSGLLWAETNIGAEIAADFGNHYSWGETSTKTSYGRDNYTLGNYDSSTYKWTYTKYTSTDGKTILDKEDDAAYVNWGTSCRMPTSYDFAELLCDANCTIQSVQIVNSANQTISAIKFTSKMNGNSIIIPGGSTIGDCYWMSNLKETSYPYAGSPRFSPVNTGERQWGLLVRPVAEP